MFETKLAIVSFAAAIMCGVSHAQQPAAANPPAATPTAAAEQVPDGGMPTYLHPETPEQRRARLGTAQDPGINPDPNTHYWRFGSSYHIEKFDRQWAVYDQAEGFVRPYAPLNVSKELYQQNEKWVWVWMPDPTPQESVEQPVESQTALSQEQTEMYQRLRTEFTAVNIAESGKTIRFQESSQGLPSGGSYRNSLAVADMNEDGCPDIITPPQRGGNGLPEIYLGDCKGHWKAWTTTTWPYRMDYGSVVAADFNKDGHMDLAFGIHLNGVRVMLGDGKGHFVDSSAGIEMDFPTRRIVVADVNADGYPDVVALSEGPSASARAAGMPAAKMRAYVNRGKAKSWEARDLSSLGDVLGGDWLSVGKFGKSRYPGFVASSVYFNGPDILWISEDDGKWKGVGRGTLAPWQSYYFATATGRFTSKKLDDAIVSYVRTWPDQISSRVPPPGSKNVSGIDRISFTGKEPQRTSIVRWPSSVPISGMAAADFDGDGKLDLAYINPSPRSIQILLGDGKGNFREAKIEGVTVAPNNIYDIKVADVNGDGRPDIILAYESMELTAFAPRNGSIHVFLNRGAAEQPVQANK